MMTGLARRSRRAHHRRQPGPGPRDRARLRAGGRQRDAVRARRGAARARRATRSQRWRGPTSASLAMRADVSRPGRRRARWSAATHRAASAGLPHPREQRRRLRPDGRDRRRRLGRVGRARWRSTLRLGAAAAARVLPHFKAQRYGKIIQLSGGGATNPLPRLSAYAASKAAIVRLRRERSRSKCKDDGIDVNAIAPGALNTRMLDELLAAGPDAVGAGVLRAHEEDRPTSGGTPLETGAALAVFLGSAASDGITGRLLSAVWDPWDALPRASRRSRRDRRLHAAAHRPEGSRHGRGATK